MTPQRLNQLHGRPPLASTPTENGHRITLAAKEWSKIVDIAAAEASRCCNSEKSFLKILGDILHSKKWDGKTWI